ncbi:MAG: hypothetical protein IJT03_01525 [Clostridia bacterium]|nr:hypothetical protein [Clostridia bacterium]
MDNINDIISSLSSEDIEALKNAADSIFGAEKAGGSEGRRAAPDAGPAVSPEMLMKISRVMAAMNKNDGKRARLLEALKPNLSRERRKKADEAMQLIRLMDIMPMFMDIGGNMNDRSDEK